MLKNEYLFVALSILISALGYTSNAKADQGEADQIKKLRSDVTSEKESKEFYLLSPEEKEKRQVQIDAEVTYNFKKRIQMRPSDVKAIDPACDQWLLLYQETWSEIAREGIRKTCP